jgi:ATP-dependent Lon protease
MNTATKLPVLPLKNLVVFPHIYTPIGVGREFSKNAVFDSIDRNFSEILVVLQKEETNEHPFEKKDFEEVGVLCKIIKFEEDQAQDDAYRLLVKGINRIKLKDIDFKDKCIYGSYELMDNLSFNLKTEENKILYDTLIKDLVYIIEKGFVNDALIPVKELENPIATCYLFLSITKRFQDNQEMLVCEDAKKLVTEAYHEVMRQKSIIKLKDNIVEKAKDNMTENQKQYFLREQIKAIKKELGDEQESDLDSYTNKFAGIKKHLSDSNKKEIVKNLKKLKNAASESYEVSVIKNYLDYVFDLPWNEFSKEILDIKKAKKLLNTKHCFLDDVKERILEFLSVRKLNPESKAPIICFVGPPGVGKTSFAQSIAEVIGRESVRISLGGVKDESEIRDSRYETGWKVKSNLHFR